MRFLNLVLVCVVLFVGTVSSEDEISIKKGTFPYMAFVYYPDSDYTEAMNTKFTRSAVLIRENWLISSSLHNEDTSIAFPETTLVARLGAISIDSKYTLNEDEDEQEREIIQIVRSYPEDANSTEWWNTIYLLKTLMPFNMTLAVSTITEISNKLGNNWENCFMLFYANRNRNVTDDKILMQMSVELLPPSVENCGNNFRNDTIMCANRSEEKNDKLDSNFCLVNSGGPLICNYKLTGIQIYIENCNEPYLYHLLNAWNDLIICATEEKCQEERCTNICFSINKDPLTDTTPKIIVSQETLVKLVDGYSNDTKSELTIIPTFTTIEESNETEATKTTLATLIVEEEITTKRKMPSSVTLTSEDTSSSSSVIEEITSILSNSPFTSNRTVTSDSNENTSDEVTDYPDERGRKANVLAQQHTIKQSRSHAAINNILRSFKYILCTCSVVIYFL